MLMPQIFGRFISTHGYSEKKSLARANNPWPGLKIRGSDILGFLALAKDYYPCAGIFSFGQGFLALAKDYYPWRQIKIRK